MKFEGCGRPAALKRALDREAGGEPLTPHVQELLEQVDPTRVVHLRVTDDALELKPIDNWCE